MPRLRVLAGESPETLKPISANKSTGYELKTPTFEGEISVFLKNYMNEDGNTSNADYFDNPSREGCTWSIQVRGRFLKELNADDILFGNVFDRPLPLPHGSGAAIQFMHMIDPVLEHDLYSQKPWALSPLVATMPYFSLKKDPSPPGIIEENASSILPEHQTRKGYFRSAEHRRSMVFKPDMFIECDFCHGRLSFENGLNLDLPLVHFDLMRYWDGRPLWFVCCERSKDGKGPGNSIWCVGFEIMEEYKCDSEPEDTEKGKPFPDISGDVD